MQVMSRLSNYPIIRRKGVLPSREPCGISCRCLSFSSLAFPRTGEGIRGGEVRVWLKGALYANLAGKVSLIVKRIAKAEQMLIKCCACRFEFESVPPFGELISA